MLLSRLSNKLKVLNTFLKPKFKQRYMQIKPMNLLPKSQYDFDYMKNKPYCCNLMLAMTEYLEIIPIVFTSCVSITVCVLAILWAFSHKVDVTYRNHTLEESISRTMDLAVAPETHKIMIINQAYEPWPEMQNAIDALAEAEKRELFRKRSCEHP